MKRNGLLLPLLLTLSLMSSSASASRGLKELVEEYQYALTVEWDQQDKSFARTQEQKLKEELRLLLDGGKSPEELLHEGLNLVADERLREELRAALILEARGKMTKEDLLRFVQDHAPSFGTKGTSWSPVTKVLIGLAAGYVVFNLILFAIYFSDTDPDYGKTTGEQPPKT